MKFKSAITVDQSEEAVWEFLKEPTNLAKWDKNIYKVVSTSSKPVGVGYTFDTFASEQPGQKKGARMSYRIIEYAALEYIRILLVRSRIFKKAIWTMTVKPTPKGTRISCKVHLTFRIKYLYLLALLLISKRCRLLTDMEKLPAALNSLKSTKTIS
jgi:hypothetical protein